MRGPEACDMTTITARAAKMVSGYRNTAFDYPEGFSFKVGADVMMQIRSEIQYYMYPESGAPGKVSRLMGLPVKLVSDPTAFYISFDSPSGVNFLKLRTDRHSE